MCESTATTIDKPGHRLKAIRLARHITQKAIAYGAPCAPATITDIELYNKRPGMDIQTRIAAFLGVEPTDIWPVETPEFITTHQIDA